MVSITGNPEGVSAMRHGAADHETARTPGTVVMVTERNRSSSAVVTGWRIQRQRDMWSPSRTGRCSDTPSFSLRRPVGVGGGRHEVDVVDCAVVDLRHERRQRGQSAVLGVVEVGHHDRFAVHVEAHAHLDALDLVEVGAGCHDDALGTMDAPTQAVDRPTTTVPLQPFYFVAMHHSALCRRRGELSGEHAARVDEAGRGPLDEDPGGRRQVQTGVDHLRGVGDQAVVDGERTGDPDELVESVRILGEVERPDRVVELDAGALAEWRVLGDRPPRQHGTLEPMVDDAGDAPES